MIYLITIFSSYPISNLSLYLKIWYSRLPSLQGQGKVREDRKCIVKKSPGPSCLSIQTIATLVICSPDYLLPQAFVNLDICHPKYLPPEKFIGLDICLSEHFPPHPFVNLDIWHRLFKPLEITIVISDIFLTNIEIVIYVSIDIPFCKYRCLDPL